MIITTTPGNIAGYRIVKTHGLVRGNTLRARHIGRDIMAGLRAMVGGELTDYTKMLAEAREQALDRMVEEASQMGANAVIGIARLHTDGKADAMLARTGIEPTRRAQTLTLPEWGALYETHRDSGDPGG